MDLPVTPGAPNFAQLLDPVHSQKSLKSHLKSYKYAREVAGYKSKHTCEICGAYYSSKIYLNRHMKKHLETADSGAHAIPSLGSPAPSSSGFATMIVPPAPLLSAISSGSPQLGDTRVLASFSCFAPMISPPSQLLSSIQSDQAASQHNHLGEMLRAIEASLLSKSNDGFGASSQKLGEQADLQKSSGLSELGEVTPDGQTSFQTPRALPTNSKLCERGESMSSMGSPTFNADQLLGESTSMFHGAQKPQQPKFECEHCEIEFKDAVLGQLHTSFHTIGNPFQCSLCGAQCYNEYAFNMHLVQSSHN